MGDSYTIGIDAGSSSIKIGMFNRIGNMVAMERLPIEQLQEYHHQTSHEYDSESWWRAVTFGIRKLVEKTGVSPNAIAAVGLTGQIGTHIILDRKGVPLLPAIGWQDNRASREAAWLDSVYPDSDLDDLLGIHLPSGTAWPIPRLLWLQNNYPEIIEKGFILLQPKDYIGFRLTDTICTDTLSLRGLVNPRNQKIDSRIETEILKMDGIKECLPVFCDPTKNSETITHDAACATGLLEGTPVLTGCGDFHASLIGSGIVDESCGFNITGTSEHIGILCGHDNHNAYDLRLGRYPHVVDGYDVLYGATSAGGGSIQWFCNKFLPEIDKNLFENEIEMRMRKIPDLQGILFLPYLNGERAPIWNSDARGVFFGLEATHGIDQMLQAVFEGVALSLYDCWAVIGEHVQMPEMLRVAGAASTNGLWNQMKADVFGIPVTTMQCKESTCLGAAIIAAVGAGWYPDLTNAISQMTHIGSSYVPEERSTNRYRKMFSMYRKLYGLLKPLFSDLASFRSQT